MYVQNDLCLRESGGAAPFLGSTWFWRPLPAAKPTETFELNEVPDCWGRAIKRTAGCLACILGAALAMLGVVVAFGIGSALAHNVCTPALQGGSPIASLLALAPVAETVRLCSPYHDIDL